MACHRTKNCHISDALSPQHIEVEHIGVDRTLTVVILSKLPSPWPDLDPISSVSAALLFEHTRPLLRILLHSQNEISTKSLRNLCVVCSFKKGVRMCFNLLLDLSTTDGLASSASTSYMRI
jgi:hypothetical protein